MVAAPFFLSKCAVPPFLPPSLPPSLPPNLASHQPCTPSNSPRTLLRRPHETGRAGKEKYEVCGRGGGDRRLQRGRNGAEGGGEGGREGGRVRR